MTIGAGNQIADTGADRQNFVVGQWLSPSPEPATHLARMNGAITAFNAGTGNMAVDVVNA